jgi:hypothetical protein
MFRGRGITLTKSTILSEYNNGESSIILKNLPNCTSASAVFYNNSIEGYNKYMFADSFGSSNGVNISNILGKYDSSKGGIIAGITLDFLENIADRVSSFGNGIYEGLNSAFEIWNTSETVQLSKIFNYTFNKLTTISGFTIYDKSNTIDFKGLFDNVKDKITDIYSFMSLTDSCTNINNFEGLFYNLSNLKVFKNKCLNINTVTVNWFNLFNWEALLSKYGSTYFGDSHVDNTSNNSWYTSLQINKTID